MSEWGKCLGYVGTPCPNCGRYRLERYENNKEVCEKCGWCPQEQRYIDREKMYPIIDENFILTAVSDKRKCAKDHKDEMIAMREAGKTYREIAEHFGISKQWVHIIISEACNCEDPARKCSVDIEKIVYEGIYELFANDYKMTITKFARIAFGVKTTRSFHKERIRRLIYNYGEASLTLRHIRNICEYIGEPFEYVFKVRG